MKGLNSIRHEQRKRVLVVDDEPEVTERLKRFFERLYPIDVITASDGYAALGVLACEEIDAVILDIEMPNCCGWTVLEHIIQLYPRTVAIVVTGVISHELQADVKGARFLLKPVPLVEFKHLIYQLFGMVSHE